MNKNNLSKNWRESLTSIGDGMNRLQDSIDNFGMMW